MGATLFSSFRKHAVLNNMNMSKQSINAPSFPVPTPFLRWSELDTLQVGSSLSFPARLYTQLNDAVCYRIRKHNKTFTRRQSGDTLTVWRLA